MIVRVHWITFHIEQPNIYMIGIMYLRCIYAYMYSINKLFNLVY